MAVDALPEGRPGGRAFAAQSQSDTGSGVVCSTAAGRRAALVAGRLSRQPEVAGRLAVPQHPPDNDAELVLRCYLHGGVEALGELRGHFAAVVWDGHEDLLIAVRDPMGLHPLFWAGTHAALLVSDDVDTLLAAPDTGTDWNRAALADHLRGRWPDPEETFFSGIRRVPAGHALVARGAQVAVSRLWRPTWAEKPLSAKSELCPEFDEVFRAAVNRCLHPGGTAILLSGGLDSVSVAVTAAELARAGDLPAPIALSMRFPYPGVDEERTQREVARRLGLPIVVQDIARSVAPSGVLQATLELARIWPVLVTGPWLAPYLTLGRSAVDQSCSVILSGTGADEWLVPSPYHAADLMAAGNVVGMLRLVAAARRSVPTSLAPLLRSYGWDHGLRPLLARRALGTHPLPLANRARRLRMAAATPSWLAPDPSLRRELGGRVEAPSIGSSLSAQHWSDGLDSPVASMEMEDLHQMGRQLGRPILCPFLDPDLIELVGRLSPTTLNAGGRWKGLLRARLDRSFPDLGFGEQKKVAAGPTFGRLLKAEGPTLWRSQQGSLTLSQLGVVEARSLELHADNVLRDGSARARAGLFRLQLLEAYVTARTQGP